MSLLCPPSVTTVKPRPHTPHPPLSLSLSFWRNILFFYFLFFVWYVEITDKGHQKKIDIYGDFAEGKDKAEEEYESKFTDLYVLSTQY